MNSESAMSYVFTIFFLNGIIIKKNLGTFMLAGIGHNSPNIDPIAIIRVGFIF